MPFSLDILIILGAVAALSGAALMLGRARMVAMFLSLYAGLTLYMSFPYADYFSKYTSTEFEKSLLLTAVLLGLSFLSYLALKGALDNFSDSGSWLHSLALGTLGVALVMVILQQVLPFEAIYTFSDDISRFFTFEQALFWWLLGGLMCIFALMRR